MPATALIRDKQARQNQKQGRLAENRAHLCDWLADGTLKLLVSRRGMLDRRSSAELMQRLDDGGGTGKATDTVDTDSSAPLWAARTVHWLLVRCGNSDETVARVLAALSVEMEGIMARGVAVQEKMVGRTLGLELT